jgi:hypothetical protein
MMERTLPGRRCTLWLLMIFVVNIVSVLLITLISYRMFPPAVSGVHANDDITILRLGE